MKTEFSKITFLLLSFLTICAFAGQIITSNEFRYVVRNWRELRGKSIDEVVTKILNEYPTLKIKVRSAKFGIHSEIEPNTVLLFRNETGAVVNWPEAAIKIRVVLRTWPEVVGLTAFRAREIILQESPDSQIEIVVDGTPVTADRNLDRVRIFINSDGIVVKAPETG